MTLGATPQPQFHRDRPSDLRQAPPWHRLAYIVNELPIAISQLSQDLNVQAGNRVLDFGCAERPYHHLFEHAEVTGADLPGNPSADVFLNEDGSLPVAGGSFDAVLSTQVLEHVLDPETYLDECFRVLKPGGRMLLSTHGIMAWHPDPVDCWRWTAEGLRRIVERAGFRVERVEGVMGLGAAGLQLVLDEWYHRVPVRARAPLALVMQGLIRLLDGLSSDEARRHNALVYLVVAVRP